MPYIGWIKFSKLLELMGISSSKVSSSPHVPEKKQGGPYTAIGTLMVSMTLISMELLELLSLMGEELSLLVGEALELLLL